MLQRPFFAKYSPVLLWCVLDLIRGQCSDCGNEEFLEHIFHPDNPTVFTGKAPLLCVCPRALLSKLTLNILQITWSLCIPAAEQRARSPRANCLKSIGRDACSGWDGHKNMSSNCMATCSC